MDYFKIISKHLIECFFVLSVAIGSVVLNQGEVQARTGCPDDGCDGIGVCYNGVPGKYCDINSSQECEEKDCGIVTVR